MGSNVNVPPQGFVVEVVNEDYLKYIICFTLYTAVWCFLRAEEKERKNCCFLEERKPFKIKSRTSLKHDGRLLKRLSSLIHDNTDYQGILGGCIYYLYSLL